MREYQYSLKLSEVYSLRTLLMNVAVSEERGSAGRREVMEYAGLFLLWPLFSTPPTWVMELVVTMEIPERLVAMEIIVLDVDDPTENSAEILVFTILEVIVDKYHK